MKQSINCEAVKTNEMKKRSVEEFFVQPAADAMASVEPDALSRFVGEGGPEGPAPVTELLDIPLENGIWRRRRRGGPSSETKKAGLKLSTK